MRSSPPDASRRRRVWSTSSSARPSASRARGRWRSRRAAAALLSANEDVLGPRSTTTRSTVAVRAGPHVARARTRAATCEAKGGREGIARSARWRSSRSCPLRCGRSARSEELDRIGLRRAAPGELTASERRVAELAAAGLTNREVAARLFMSPKTVEANVARAYRKLGIRSRAELGARLADTQDAAQT